MISEDIICLRAEMHLITPQFRVFKVRYLLTQFVGILIEDEHVDLKSLYIEGTKIEAIANRYTFVWRKSVEKYQNKLRERMIQELKLPEDSTLDEVISSVNKAFNSVRNMCSRLKIEFVHGIGRRKNQEQRNYEYYLDIKRKVRDLSTAS